MHLLISPHVLALVVRDDIEAFPERLLNAVFVVFYAGHISFLFILVYRADQLIGLSL